MYELNTLLKIKENCLSIKEYILLKIIEDNSLHLFKEEYIDELLKLNKEEFLDQKQQLLLKGFEVINKIEGNKPKTINYLLLLDGLKSEMKKLTGKEQYKSQGKYPFIPNKIDFQQKLKKVIEKYKLKDVDKIEKLLINHIKIAYKKNFEYIQLIQYYIMKDGESQLATDYESDIFIETVKEEIPQEIKNLF